MRTATKCDCSREAARDERDDARAQYEDARQAAEEDGYSRYGGGGW